MLSVQATIVESLPSGVQVDRATGVIKNVKFVGLNSANGRTYAEAGLRKAVGLYEGARLNVDHKVDPKSGRTVSDRIGSARNLRFVEGQGIFGDAHLNPAHSQFSQIAWEAEEAAAGRSSGIGFSHVAECTLRPGPGPQVVESIVRVRSVDIVADPATTKSLFESTEPNRMDLSTLTIEQLRTGRPDLVTDIEKPLKESISAEQGKVKAFEDKEKRSKLEESVRGELKAAGLDPADAKKVPPFFFEQCCGADASTRKTLIEDRAGLVKATPPKAPEKPVTEGVAPSLSTDTVSEQDVSGWLNRLTR